jgi:hypothetical protein
MSPGVRSLRGQSGPFARTLTRTGRANGLGCAPLYVVIGHPDDLLQCLLHSGTLLPESYRVIRVIRENPSLAPPGPRKVEFRE